MVKELAHIHYRVAVGFEVEHLFFKIGWVDAKRADFVVVDYGDNVSLSVF